MKAKRPLPVVPPPCDGEAIASWLARVAALYGVALPEFLAYLGIAPTARERGWLGWPPFTHAELELLATQLRRPVGELALMNGTVWTATCSGELAFCPRCLAEDPRRGVPMFWRRVWLDAFAAWCPVHDRPLQGVAGAALASTHTGEEAAALLLGKEVLAELPGLAHLASRAGELHAAVSGECDAHAMYARYSLRLPVQLRAVAVDVLDVLLSVRRGDPRDPPLFRLAEVLGLALDPRDYRVKPFSDTRRITHLRRLDARITALAIADALLATRSNEPLPALASLDALRHPWLWHLLSVEAVEALKSKARGWPTDYVKERWLELLDDRQRAMVRCKRVGPGGRFGLPVAEPEVVSSRRYWRTVADY